MRVALFTLIFIASAASCLAQTPFSELDIRIQGTQNVNRTVLHENWKPARGWKFSLSTPFYAGDWEIHLGIHRFNASSPTPGFGVLWISSGWGNKIPVTRRITLHPSIAIGNYRMSFDDSGLESLSESNESDFVASVAILISFDIGDKWFLFGAADYLRIQTYPLMRLWFTSAGIGFRLQTGRRIQTFLN